MRKSKLFAPSVSAALLVLCLGCGAPVPQITQGFIGGCSTLPNPADPVHAGWAANGYGVLIYGLGRIDTPTCNGVGSVDLFDGTGVPDGIGQAVLGNGNLTSLSVSVTSPGTTPQSGKIIVYINGAPSAMTCTLGTSLTCSDLVHTPGVGNHDLIAATVQLVPGDLIAGLRVAISKE